jgi:hypothetical protein
MKSGKSTEGYERVRNYAAVDGIYDLYLIGLERNSVWKASVTDDSRDLVAGDICNLFVTRRVIAPAFRRMPFANGAYRSGENQDVVCI